MSELRSDILFTLELTEEIPTVFYRFQKDGSWRMYEDQSFLQDTDYVATSPNQIMRRQLPGSIVEINGHDSPVAYRGAEGSNSWNTLYYTSQVFRRDCPPLPRSYDLAVLLRHGDDSQANNLVLTVDGEFGFRKYDEDMIALRDPSIAVYLDSFPAIEGLYDLSPVEGIILANILFSHFIGFWYDHLEEGRTNIRCTPKLYSTPEQTVELLENFKKDWTPQF